MKILFHFFQYVFVTSEQILPEKLEKTVVQRPIYYHQHQVDNGQWFRCSRIDRVKLDR